MEWMLLPLKRYFEFSGRSRRMEYWMFALFQVLIYVGLAIIGAVLVGGTAGMMGGGSADAATGGMVGMLMSMGIIAIVIGIVWLGLIVPSLAVAVRRLHDTNRSGFWLFAYVGPYIVGYIIAIAGAASESAAMTMVGGLITLLGFIGAIVLLVFMCLPGTVGPNRYGPDPKEGERGVAGAPAAY